MYKDSAPLNSPEHQKNLDSIIIGTFEDRTRKDRRNLLFLSFIASFLALGKMAPTEASAFGMHIQNLRPGFVYASLLLLNIYFLLGFSIHAFPEYKAMRTAIRESFRGLDALVGQPWYRRCASNFVVSWRYWLWVTFDYWSPHLIGVSALIVLVYRLFHLA